MKLVEFVNAEDLSTYDPGADKVNSRQRDDTRKEELTLKLLNHLKKMRALKKLESLKRQDILSAMYSQGDGGGGGGMPF